LPDGETARARRLIVLLALALLSASMVFPSLIAAAAGPKVVVIVGPVGAYNASYKEEARDVIAEARRYTSNVVALFTPNATWARVREHTRGASILVYFGHGWGYPSRYGPYDGDRQNGMALDPSSGANGVRRVYYGENRIRASIRLAPAAAVLLYRLCYASGNTEPRLSEGTTSQSKRRVDGFGAGFLDTGAQIVIADGHPSRPENYVRQLFTTDRAMWEVFRRAPNYNGHAMGPYGSARTPGARYIVDPDRGGSDPKGFYRSIVGNLSLRTTQVTGRAPLPGASPSVSPPPSGQPSLEPTPPTDGVPSDEASGTPAPDASEPVSASPTPTTTEAPPPPPTDPPPAEASPPATADPPPTEPSPPAPDPADAPSATADPTPTAPSEHPTEPASAEPAAP
jgi:hypothetical protein